MLRCPDDECGQCGILPCADAEHRTYAVDEALGDVRAERKRQHARWGEQNHPNVGDSDLWRRSCHNLGRRLEAGARRRLTGPPTYEAILMEEVGEALQELSDDVSLEAELIQVAAVAVAWVEAIRRRRAA